MHLQPFELFKPAYINRLISLKKFYLVSQAYNAGHDHFSNDQKTGVLLTDYDDIGLAKIHLAAVKHDRYASVINLQNEIHLLKLKEMLGEESKYRVFWAVVGSNEQLKKKVDARYRDHIRRYIDKNTNWRISADERIRPQLQVIFGEIFVTLKRGAQELRIKFTDIQQA
jgi:hypothetical protein